MPDSVSALKCKKRSILDTDSEFSFSIPLKLNITIFFIFTIDEISMSPLFAFFMFHLKIVPDKFVTFP